MQSIVRSLLVGAAGLLAGALNPARADVGFRNDGTGVFPEVHPPLHWSAASNVVWTTPLKTSNASPIVLGDKVIACEEPDVLLALQFADGRRLWAATNSYFDVLPPAEAETARANLKLAGPLNQSLSAAEEQLRAAEKQAKAQTNAVEAKAALDAARKEVAALRKHLEPLQKYKLPDTHNTNGYTTPTPVTDGRNLYVVFCSGVVAAFSPEGQRLWARVLPVRPHNASWGHSASPRLADGLLLVHFGNRLFAIDARTGVDKWTAEAVSGFGSPFVDKVDGIPTAITPGGDFFSVADGRKLAGSVFNFPWNGPVAGDGVAYKIDENGAAAYALHFDGAGKQPAPLWTTKVPSGRYYATAVLQDGLLYNVSQSGTLIALDARNGSVVYEQALGFGGGTVYPSPALAGGRLYVSCDNGKTVVVKPGRTYEELARNQMPAFRSSPTFVGDSLLIRTTGGLLRIAASK